MSGRKTTGNMSILRVKLRVLRGQCGLPGLK